MKSLIASPSRPNLNPLVVLSEPLLPCGQPRHRVGDVVNFTDLTPEHRLTARRGTIQTLQIKGRMANYTVARDAE